MKSFVSIITAFAFPLLLVAQHTDTPKAQLLPEKVYTIASTRTISSVSGSQQMPQSRSVQMMVIETGKVEPKGLPVRFTVYLGQMDDGSTQKSLDNIPVEWVFNFTIDPSQTITDIIAKSNEAETPADFARTVCMNLLEGPLFLSVYPIELSRPVNYTITDSKTGKTGQIEIAYTAVPAKTQEGAIGLGGDVNQQTQGSAVYDPVQRFYITRVKTEEMKMMIPPTETEPAKAFSMQTLIEYKTSVEKKK